MTYIALTVEHRLQMLKERLLGYEALHYQQICEIEIAVKQGLDQVVADASRAAHGFEQAIEWCKAEIDKLENES